MPVCMLLTNSTTRASRIRTAPTTTQRTAARPSSVRRAASRPVSMVVVSQPAGPAWSGTGGVHRLPRPVTVAGLLVAGPPLRHVGVAVVGDDRAGLEDA